VGAGLSHPETLLRIRGNIVCYADAAQAPGGLVDIGVGIILAQGGQGTTVLSNPITDADAPWVWYDRFCVGYEEMVTDVIDVPGLSSYRGVVDSKAMRIQRLDQEFQFVLQNSTVGTAMNVNFCGSFRFLFGT